jgi:hypothetical protein
MGKNGIGHGGAPWVDLPFWNEFGQPAAKDAKVTQRTRKNFLKVFFAILAAPAM